MPLDLRDAVRWQERLIADGFDALPAFLEAHPGADPKRLKGLIQKARAMRHKHGTPRFLLRYIRALDAAASSAPPAGDTVDQALVPPTVSRSISSDG
jgi:ribosomal 50S subunit-associated protein YjgA (DUF615 family)